MLPGSQQTGYTVRMASVHPWLCTFVAFLDHWQTLIAGVLALLGAGLTVWIVHRQIRQTTKSEEKRRLREEQAARAVLPLALSELAQYADDCIRLIAPHIPANGDPPEFPKDFVVPRIPEGTIEPLRDCARYADANIARQIHTMLGKLQVQHSRLDSIRQRTLQNQMRVLHYYEGVGAVIDAAEVQTLMGELLLYARGKSIDPPMSFHQRILTPLVQAGLIDHAKLVAEVDRRFPSDYVPPTDQDA